MRTTRRPRTDRTERVRMEVRAEAFAFAEESPLPDESELYTDMYDEGGVAWTAR